MPSKYDTAKISSPEGTPDSPDKLPQILSNAICLDLITEHLAATSITIKDDLVNLACTSRRNLAAMISAQPACRHPDCLDSSKNLSINIPCGSGVRFESGEVDYPKPCGRMICDPCAHEPDESPEMEKLIYSRFRPCCAVCVFESNEKKKDCKCSLSLRLFTSEGGWHNGGWLCRECWLKVRVAEMKHKRTSRAVAKKDPALKEVPFPTCMLPCGRMLPPKVGSEMWKTWKGAKASEGTEMQIVLGNPVGFAWLNLQAMVQMRYIWITLEPLLVTINPDHKLPLSSFEFNSVPESSWATNCDYTILAVCATQLQAMAAEMNYEVAGTLPYWVSATLATLQSQIRTWLTPGLVPVIRQRFITLMMRLTQCHYAINLARETGGPVSIWDQNPQTDNPYDQQGTGVWFYDDHDQVLTYSDVLSNKCKTVWKCLLCDGYLRTSNKRIEKDVLQI